MLAYGLNDALAGLPPDTAFGEATSGSASVSPASGNAGASPGSGNADASQASAAGGRRPSSPMLTWFAQPPELPPGVRDAAAGRLDLDWQHRAAIALLEHRSAQGEPPPRFLNLYTHEPDTVSHQRWRWAEPELFPFVSSAGIEGARGGGGGRLPADRPCGR